MRKSSAIKNSTLLLNPILWIATACLLMSACSTRQVVDGLQGSTEQRLVTHSVDELMTDLPVSPLDKVHAKKVYIETHFIQEHPVLDYASARIRSEISLRHQVTWVTSSEVADFKIDVFFTSLGTDQDSFGLSLPLPVTGDELEVARVDLLSFNMYHGVSELYLYLTENKTQEITRMDNQKALIRTDKIVLPFMSIPVNTLK